MLIIILSLAACKDKIICPAFQSTYILDDSVRMAYYSYVWKLDEIERTKYLTSLNQPKQQDTSGAITIPSGTKIDYYAYAGQYVVPAREVKKTKYGIVKYEPYWLKSHHLRTAPMENVLAPDAPYVPQMDTSAVEVGDIVAADFTDSVALDATVVAQEGVVSDSLPDESFKLPTLARAPPPPPKPPTKYLYGYDPEDKALNVEQDYYNKYFGEYLIAKPREKVADVPDQNALTDDTSDADLDSSDESDEEPKRRRGLFGGVKKKRKSKEAKNDLIEEEAFDEPIEEDATPEEAPSAPVEGDGF